MLPNTGRQVYVGWLTQSWNHDHFVDAFTRRKGTAKFSVELSDSPKTPKTVRYERKNPQMSASI
jgi:hypothetical protein